MMLRGTAKLLALLRPPHLSVTDPTDDDWYGTLLWLEARKCVLLTHSGTLFSIFVPDVRAAQLRPVAPWLTTLTRDHLASEQLPTDTLGRLDHEDLSIAKTANRHILGVINDTALHIDHAIADAGGLNTCDIPDLNQHLRRGLHRRNNHHVRPVELAAARAP